MTIIKKYKNSILEMNQSGWIDVVNPLWWDKNYVDERKNLPFSTFRNKLHNTSIEKIVIFQEDYVPITILETSIDDLPAKFLITIRPFTPIELNEYFSSGSEINPFSDIDSSLESYRKRLDKLQSNKEWDLPLMFTPHVRGLFIDYINGGRTFVYYPFNLSSKDKNSEVKIKNTDLISKLRGSLDSEKLPYVNVLDYTIKFYDRLKYLFEPLHYHGVISTNKNIGFACGNNLDLEKKYLQMNGSAFLSKKIFLKNAEQIPFFQIFDYLKTKDSFFTYFPLQMNLDIDYYKTVPLLITNAFPNFEDELAILGVYNSSNKLNNGSVITVLTIQDPYFVLNAQELAKTYLGRNVVGFFNNRQKKKSNLEIPNPKKHIDAFDKFRKVDDSWLS